MTHFFVAMLIAKPQKNQNWPLSLSVCLSVLEGVRAACQCDAAQMVVFTALQSEYLLQSTGLADPTVTANGAVGKQTVVMRVYLSNENHFDAKHTSKRRSKRLCYCTVMRSLTRLRHFSSLYFGVYLNNCPLKKFHFSKGWNFNWCSCWLFYHSHSPGIAAWSSELGV